MKTSDSGCFLAIAPIMQVQCGEQVADGGFESGTGWNLLNLAQVINDASLARTGSIGTKCA